MCSTVPRARASPLGPRPCLQLSPGKLRRATGLWEMAGLMVNLAPPSPAVTQSGTPVFCWTPPFSPSPVNSWKNYYMASLHPHPTPCSCPCHPCVCSSDSGSRIFSRWKSDDVTPAHRALCRTVCSRWTRGPRAKKKTAKLLEDNPADYPYGHGLGKDFFNKMSKLMSEGKYGSI